MKDRRKPIAKAGFWGFLTQSSVPSPQSWPPFLSPRSCFLLIVLFAALFFIQAALASDHLSFTWDEPTFIASGWSYLDTGDFRLNPEAPPLAQVLCALPVRLFRLPSVLRPQSSVLPLPVLSPPSSVLPFPSGFHPPTYDADFAPERQVAFASRFVRANADRIESLAFWARLPVWCLGALTVVLAGLWGVRLYGPASGALTAGLMATSPNLLAHGTLATTDFACAAGMLAAVRALDVAARNGAGLSLGVPRHSVLSPQSWSWSWSWALAGVVTGLALLAKYTALLLAPVFVILLIHRWRRQRASLPSLLKGAGLMALAAFLVVTLAYGRPLDPRPYLHGLSQLYVRTTPAYQPYLLGRVLDGPVWHYHLVAFAIKTPVPTLLILAIAGAALFLGIRHRDAAVTLLVPAGVVLLASCFDSSNLGVRRILPACPFLFVFAGQALMREPCRLCAWTLAGLLAWLAVEAALVFPHHLSYFSVAAGGPSRGPYLMDDSNVDWGQDLPTLAAWQRAHPGEPPVRLRYFGTVPPAAYGVRFEPFPDDDILRPRPGLYAVSAHHLVFFRKLAARFAGSSDAAAPRPGDLDWLKRYKPIARAGSIWIYRFPDSGPLP